MSDTPITCQEHHSLLPCTECMKHADALLAQHAARAASSTLVGRRIGGTDERPVFSVSALDTQEGGAHYKNRTIQPVEYIHANNLPFIEGSVVKYITRWRDKGGVEDLKKIKHYIDLLIELEGRLPKP